jgi:hypothetical protein
LLISRLFHPLVMLLARLGAYLKIGDLLGPAEKKLQP